MSVWLVLCLDALEVSNDGNEVIAGLLGGGSLVLDVESGSGGSEGNATHDVASEVLRGGGGLGRDSSE